MTPEQAATLYNGLIVFAGGLLVWLGHTFSKKASAKPGAQTDTVELAGAVINGRDAKMLADSFDRVAANMTSLQLELVEHRKAIDRSSDRLDRNTDAAKDVCEATSRTDHELRNLANAMLMTRK